MKLFYSFLILLFFTIVGSLTAWVFTSKTVAERSFESTLFMTLVSSDENSSVEEKETASHFFAEALLGWTLSPAFVENLGFPISSRKQERANMVFQISGVSPEDLKEKQKIFESVLEKKLSQYNTLANTRFSLLLDRPVIEERIPKKSFWTMGGGIAGFFLGLFLLEGWKFWKRKKI